MVKFRIQFQTLDEENRRTWYISIVFNKALKDIMSSPAPQTPTDMFTPQQSPLAAVVPDAPQRTNRFERPEGDRWACKELNLGQYRTPENQKTLKRGKDTPPKKCLL